jgi:tetratricopeptide (TPR) repeat protein
MRKIALYDKLIQKNPNDLGASYYKARCYVDMKEYTKAVESFNECLKHDSYLATRNEADKTGKGCAAWCYQNLAYIYFLKGDYRNGIKVVSQAIELRPAYSLNYKNRGMAYLKLGKQELAQRDFARMNKLIRAPEPDDLRVLCFDHKPPF